MNTFETAKDAIIWRGDGETLVVQAWGRDSLRVRSTRAGEVLDTDFALLEPEPVDVQITVDGETAALTNGAITAVLTAWGGLDWQTGYDRFGCALEFRDADGETLLKELGSGGALKRTAREFRPLPGGARCGCGARARARCWTPTSPSSNPNPSMSRSLWTVRPRRS